MNHTIFKLFLVLLLVVANGFFVAAEFSLVSVRRSRIATLADSGDTRAQKLLGLLDNLNSYISATQLGITMASLALGWIGEPALSHILEAPLHGLVSDSVRHTIAFILAFTIITFLHIVLGELAPKTLALDRSERVALAVAWPLRLFHTLFGWPIRLLDFAGRSTVRLLGFKCSPEHTSIYTVDELRQIINIFHTSGALEADEQQMLHRIFEFSDSEVQDIMIPRYAVTALPVTATREETLELFNTLGFSRIPVYQDQLDNILGIVVRRDLEPYLSGTDAPDFDLAKLIHPPRFVPTNAQLSAALKQMQAARTHMVFVVDEYGGFEGIITLEDLLEEIVGEIDDEYDDISQAQCIKDNNGYLLDGMMTIREVNIQLSLDLPEEAPYSTIAGFVLAQAGRLLQQGESILYHDTRFTVESVDRKRIRRLRVTIERLVA
ncbi:MAG: hemolysin family protein [Desulfuromonadaceae bacterium]|nr:hemolysin family protein [Desulfuromonadaceae bacterium]MDD5107063.1 hemolysin family protein [Desulfuromonadaceae bacterium]